VGARVCKEVEKKSRYDTRFVHYVGTVKSYNDADKTWNIELDDRRKKGEIWKKKKLIDGRRIYESDPKKWENLSEDTGYIDWTDMEPSEHVCDLDKYVCCNDEDMNMDERIRDKSCKDCDKPLHASSETEVYICPQYWYRPDANHWGRCDCKCAHLCKGCIIGRKKNKGEEEKKKTEEKIKTKKNKGSKRIGPLGKGEKDKTSKKQKRQRKVGTGA